MTPSQYFNVRRESDNGPIRNMLLPFTSIPVEDDAPTTVTSVVPVPRPRPRTSLRASIQKNDEECDSDTSSTSNSCVYVIPKKCQPFHSSLPAAEDRLFTRYTPMSHLVQSCLLTLLALLWFLTLPFHFLGRDVTDVRHRGTESGPANTSRPSNIMCDFLFQYFVSIKVTFCCIL